MQSFLQQKIIEIKTWNLYSVYRNKDEKDLEGYGPNRWGSLVGMDKLSQPAWFHALRLYDSEELDIVYRHEGLRHMGRKLETVTTLGGSQWSYWMAEETGKIE